MRSRVAGACLGHLAECFCSRRIGAHVTTSLAGLRADVASFGAKVTYLRIQRRGIRGVWEVTSPSDGLVYFQGWSVGGLWTAWRAFAFSILCQEACIELALRHAVALDPVKRAHFRQSLSRVTQIEAIERLAEGTFDSALEAKKRMRCWRSEVRKVVAGSDGTYLGLSCRPLGRETAKRLTEHFAQLEKKYLDERLPRSPVAGVNFKIRRL